MFLATIGFFAAAVLVSVFVLRHSLGEAAIHANLVTFPSVAFLGVPIFAGLFGSASIVLVKMIGQPALVALLVALLGIRNPLGQEAIVLCAIPAFVVAPLLGSRYHVYETEAASTLVLTTLMMIVTLPLTIVLIGA